MIALVAAFAATSSAASPAPDCSNARTQTEMNGCAALAFQRADGELDAVWALIVSNVRDNDRSPDTGRSRYDRRSGEAILRRAQRAWTQFRDAQCEYKGLSQRGGRLESLVVSECRTALTRERVEALNNPGPE